MLLLDASNTAAHLHSLGVIADPNTTRIRELSGGVSNIVLLVEPRGAAPFVLKQSREQLRTKIDWFSTLERIWSETAALRLLTNALPAGRVPAVLFEDRPNHAFAMTVAPADATVWKPRLLAGETNPNIAEDAGVLLAAMHTAPLPPLNDDTARLFEHTTFDELRIDPFYRRIAQVHPDLQPSVQVLLDGLATPQLTTFVHADFSPKNMLVGHDARIFLVDFETAHFGDPAFDLGFFVSHLTLKALRGAILTTGHTPYLDLIQAFWRTYRIEAQQLLTRDPGLIQRAQHHAAACSLARVDGKSPVDYLNATLQAKARAFARDTMISIPTDEHQFLNAAQRQIQISHK